MARGPAGAAVWLQLEAGLTRAEGSAARLRAQLLTKLLLVCKDAAALSDIQISKIQRQMFFHLSHIYRRARGTRCPVFPLGTRSGLARNGRRFRTAQDTPDLGRRCVRPLATSCRGGIRTRARHACCGRRTHNRRCSARIHPRRARSPGPRSRVDTGSGRPGMWPRSCRKACTPGRARRSAGHCASDNQVGICSDTSLACSHSHAHTL